MDEVGMRDYAKCFALGPAVAIIAILQPATFAGDGEFRNIGVFAAGMAGCLFYSVALGVLTVQVVG